MGNDSTLILDNSGSDSRVIQIPVRMILVWHGNDSRRDSFDSVARQK